ncbi:MAG: hypothetical protein M3417_12860 [Actinomycetota bacterium]|nr:hypothetical protein [Actinomycetota bacterium]
MAGQGGVWGNLLAPLRLPERVLEALDELAELRSIRLELTRVREQTEPLGELLPALKGLNEDLGTRLDALHEILAPVDERLTTIERTTGELASEMRALHETVRAVQEDIQRMSGLRGERGLAERARDRIVGGKE